MGAKASIVIGAPTRTTYSIDGRLFQETFVDVTCNSDSFGQVESRQLVGDDGVNRTVFFKCNRPFYRYRALPVAWVPANGGLAIGETCSVTTAGDPFAPPRESFLLQDVIKRSPSGPILMSMPGDRMELEGRGHGHDNQKPQLQFGWGVVAAAFIGGAVVGGLACNAIPGCGKRNNNDDGWDEGRVKRVEDNIAQANERMALAEQANRDLRSEFVRFTDTAVTAVRLQAELAQVAANFTSTQGLINRLAGEMTDNIANAVRASKNYTDQVVAGVSRDINQLAANARSLAEQNRLQDSVIANLSVAVDNNLKSIVAQMNTNQQIAQNNTETLALSLDRNMRYLHARHRDVVRTIDSAVSALSRLINEQDIYMDLVELNQNLTNIMGVRSPTFTPFVADPNRGPNSTDSLFSFARLDAVAFVYSTPTANPNEHRAHRATLAYTCSSMRLLMEPSGVVSIIDVLGTMGPAGCNPAALDNCTCWVTHNYKTCILKANEHLSSNFANSPDINTTFCTGTPANIIVNQHITSGPALEAAMRSYGASAVSSGTRFRVWGFQQGIMASAPHAAAQAALVTTGTLLDVLDTSAGINYMQLASYVFEEANRRLMHVLRDRLIRVRLGRISNDASYETYPHVMTESGGFAKCRAMAQMYYSPNWVPVYEITPVDASAQIEVSIDGQETWTTQEVVLGATIGDDVRFQPLIVGSLDNSASFAYDIPLSNIELSPFAQAREGKVTYAMCPVDPANDDSYHTNCGLARWAGRNNATFNHFLAVNIPEAYRVSLSNRRCTGIRRAGTAAGQCAMRDNFEYEFFPDESDQETASPAGILRLGARTGSYRGTVKILAGELVAFRVSGCPSIGVLEAGNGTTLILTNPRNGTMDVRYRRYGPVCGTAAETIVLPPLGIREIFIPSCIEPNPANVHTVNVFSYRFFPEENRYRYEICNSAPINVTADSSYYFRTRGIIGAQVITQASVVVASTAARELALLRIQMANMIHQASTMIQAALMRMPGVPEVVISGIQDVRDQALEMERLGQERAFNVTTANYTDWEQLRDNGTFEVERNLQRYQDSRLNYSRAVNESQIYQQWFLDLANRSNITADALEIIGRNVSELLFLVNEIQNGAIGNLIDNDKEILQAVKDAKEARKGNSGGIFGWIKSLFGGPGNMIQKALGFIFLLAFVVIGGLLIWKLISYMLSRRNNNGQNAGAPVRYSQVESY
jgi:hypothetical protein